MTRSEGLPVPGALPAQPTAEVDEVDLVPVRTYWQLVRKRFLQHRHGHHRAGADAGCWSVRDRLPDHRGRRLVPDQPDPRPQRPVVARRAARLRQPRDQHLLPAHEGALHLAHDRVLRGPHHRGHRDHRRLDRGLRRRVGGQRADARRGHRAVAADVLPGPHVRGVHGLRQRLRDHLRDRPDGVDDRRAPGPRGVPAPPRVGLRPGGEGARRQRPTNRRPPHDPQRACAGRRGVDARASPTRSSRRRPSRSWASGCDPPRRAWATC